MSYQVLSVILTCITTWGVGTVAIASGFTSPAREILLAQDSEPTHQSANSEEVLNQQTASLAAQVLQPPLAKLIHESKSVDSIDSLAPPHILSGKAAFNPFPKAKVDGETVSLSEGRAEPAFVIKAQNSDQPSDPVPQPDQPNDRGLFRLAIIGLAIVILGGLGGAVLLLTRRGNPTSETTEEEAESSLSDKVELIQSHEKPVSRPSNSALQNGNLQTSSLSEVSDKTRREGQALSYKSVSSPRLAKVNIVDELVLELDNPDPSIRRKAIWELGQRGNSSAVQPLIGVMVNADSREQSLILAALAEIGIRTLKPMNRALALSLQDENPEVRKNAIRDLTRVYDSMGQVGRILGHAANDDDPEVRRTARWALDQLNHVRLSAVESAGLLPEGTPAVENLPGGNFFGEELPEDNFSEDEPSSRKL